MKIGDFGFARSLTPQGLADTLCGSPLYMAPEIIQNQKYDAKADLWSVGAILFQLVTGKPPFDGNSQLQLFQNILTSTGPQFPPEALKELHSDCLDLCRGLLRQNPVERLTFKEFFNHNFLQEPRQSLLHPSERFEVQHLVTSTSDNMFQLHSGHHVESLVDDPVVLSSVLNDTLALQRNTRKKTIGIQTVETSGFGGSRLSKQPQVSRLMESIEKDYVLVNHHFASLEAFSDYFEASVQDNSICKVSICTSKRPNVETGVPMQTNDPSLCHAGQLEDKKSSEHVALEASYAFDVLSKMQGTSSLSPSNRLEFLHLYVQILAELSCEKYNAQLYLESFAVELVVLAIWKKALEVCKSWMDSINKGVLPASTSANETGISYGDVGSSQNMEKKINFCDPMSVYMWAKEGFIAAVDSAEKLSRHIQNMDGRTAFYCREYCSPSILSK
ncbi:hypothetical protein PIB30_011688 [Stylosanthes scabra]|uniref:Protein kinase domain-containing protein n=1 Tax=Stylosanthes scabra TaxID=79078 RepID=A0ABU6Y7M8_9FABA|nr:hypothetical protein [Stylosanthes scabra]